MSTKTTKKSPAKKSSAKKAAPDSLNRRELYSFALKFDDTELKKKAQQLAAAHQTKREIEDELKKVKSEFKSKIEEQNTAINLLSEQVNSGKRQVREMCDCIYDFEKGTKTYSHGSVQVGVEKMEAHDYQTTIEDEAKHAGAIPLEDTIA